MSSFSRWSYTADLTFWPVTYDKSGQPTTGTPQVFKGSWKQGGNSATDVDGVEFVPRSTYWLESEPASVPQRQWRVLPGVYVGAAPPEAEIVRLVRSYDDTTFGSNDGPPDYEILT